MFFWSSGGMESQTDGWKAILLEHENELKLWRNLLRTLRHLFYLESLWNTTLVDVCCWMQKDNKRKTFQSFKTGHIWINIWVNLRQWKWTIWIWTTISVFPWSAECPSVMGRLGALGLTLDLFSGEGFIDQPWWCGPGVPPSQLWF